jgi:hypothetical protein
MNATRNAGMLRLMGSGSLAAFALLAQGALTFAPLSAGAQGGAAAGAGPTKVMVTKDTIRGDRMMIYRLTTPKIDSLIRRLNDLPLGSAEFFAVDSAIQAAVRSIPRPAEFASSPDKIRIEFSTPRAVLRASPMDVIPQGWLGFTALAVNRTWYSPVGSYLQYFEYPTIVAIEANSPASRAGVRVGDSLVAYNGLDVQRQALNMTQLLEPGREVSVRLRREGESREFQLTVEKAPLNLIVERRAAAAEQMASTASMEERRIVETQVAAVTRAVGPTRPARAPMAGTMVGATTARATPKMVPAQSGVLGAAMIEVDAGLASAVRGMDGRRGVFVTVVPEGSPADRAGIRVGDVILRVESSDVSNTAQLGLRLYREEANGAEKIKLTILRAGKTRDITYVPPR